MGTWRLRDEEYVDQLAMLSGGSVESVEYVSGDYTMDLNADGTYSGYRMAWTLSMSSPDGVIVFEITSNDPGSWTADEETISISESGSKSQVRIWVEEDGELILLPLDPSLFPTVSEPIVGTGRYQCLGDVLEIMIDSEAGPLPATFDRLN